MEKRLAVELLKPKRKRFQRRRVYSPNVDAIWTADLLDIHKYARQNQNHKFILVVIDRFSKYAWARPLKNKTAIATAGAIRMYSPQTKRVLGNYGLTGGQNSTTPL